MDALFTAADTALRTLFAQPHAATPCPTVAEYATQLTDTEKRKAAGLMRVNHVGEVCAQALYTAQALAARRPSEPRPRSLPRRRCNRNATLL